MDSSAAQQHQNNEVWTQRQDHLLHPGLIPYGLGEHPPNHQKTPLLYRVKPITTMLPPFYHTATRSITSKEGKELPWSDEGMWLTVSHPGGNTNAPLQGQL